MLLEQRLNLQANDRQSAICTLRRPLLDQEAASRALASVPTALPPRYLLIKHMPRSQALILYPHTRVT